MNLLYLCYRCINFNMRTRSWR